VGPDRVPVSLEGAQAAGSGAKPPAVPRQPYLLQPGDSFDVKFFYSKELNESVVIRPDGKISLQLVGEIQAAGLEPGNLERELHTRYGKVLRDPTVTVIVKQVAPQRVFVAGEVRSPGEVVLQPDMTALQAVSRAGFFTRDAETRNVVVLRYKGTDGPEFIVLDIKALMDGRTDAHRDVALLPMDIVFVPQTQIAGLADFFGRYVGNIVPLWRNLGFSMIYYTNSAKVIQP
jgi:protein involved in polysaccharide export with SLBB domain